MVNVKQEKDVVSVVAVGWYVTGQKGTQSAGDRNPGNVGWSIQFHIGWVGIGP